MEQKEKKYLITVYRNCVRARLKNRAIILVKKEDIYVFYFTKFIPKEDRVPLEIATNIKNKKYDYHRNYTIQTAQFSVTSESFGVMVAMVNVYEEKIDFITPDI